MRIRISHETTFSFATPARSAIVNLRMTPRSFDSQYVLRWRVGVDLDCALRHCEDSLGNIVHSFSYHRPMERFTISAFGEVETSDSIGVVRGGVETLPADMFLRESPQAVANAKLREFLGDELAPAVDPLDRLHRLMRALHHEVAFDPEATEPGNGAAEAFAMKRGSAIDLAHLFIASARSLGVPARLVSGFVAPDDPATPAKFEVWAEALAPGLGWIAFDCVRNLCANDRYVRVAIGIDAASAQPIRASHSGQGTETIETSLRVQSPMTQEQSQRQS
jgi:transglutaminase-like putative cysteine protease